MLVLLDDGEALAVGSGGMTIVTTHVKNNPPPTPQEFSRFFLRESKLNGAQPKLAIGKVDDFNNHP